MLRTALIHRALVRAPRGLLGCSPARLLVCVPTRTRSVSTQADAFTSLERRLDAHRHATVDVAEVRRWLTTARAESAAGPSPLQDQAPGPLLRSELAGVATAAALPTTGTATFSTIPTAAFSPASPFAATVAATSVATAAIAAAASAATGAAASPSASTPSPPPPSPPPPSPSPPNSPSPHAG